MRMSWELDFYLGYVRFMKILSFCKYNDPFLLLDSILEQSRKQPQRRFL